MLHQVQRSFESKAKLCHGRRATAETSQSKFSEKPLFSSCLFALDKLLSAASCLVSARLASSTGDSDMVQQKSVLPCPHVHNSVSERIGSNAGMSSDHTHSGQCLGTQVSVRGTNVNEPARSMEPLMSQVDLNQEVYHAINYVKSQGLSGDLCGN